MTGDIIVVLELILLSGENNITSDAHKVGS